jgi:16S rRNA (adenine1518-N6/adenine1519-N6)-dimethyltransferase
MLKKKSLGQHFLTSPHYLALIADTAHISQGEQILEIGPGEGVLTRELLSRGAIVHAVEKDHRLIPLLTETFAKEIEAGSLILKEGDVLEYDISYFFSEKAGAEYTLVGNIPYYITGALLEKFLSAQVQPSRLVFLVQKEVAERIARSEKESILSLSVKAYGNPKYIKTVPAGAFSPPPEVDSAILLIENISRDNFEDAEHEKKFFALLHAGFAHKRKLLKRNLEGLLGEKAGETLTQANIAENARAEDVPLDAWLTLAKHQ